MSSNVWRTLAIVFMTLFIVETAIVAWGVMIVNQEQDNINMCHYDICGDYLDADLVDGVCFCYEEGFAGDYIVGHTEVMR
jgi:hypothetical protein